MRLASIPVVSLTLRRRVSFVFASALQTPGVDALLSEGDQAMGFRVVIKRDTCCIEFVAARQCVLLVLGAILVFAMGAE